MEPETTRDPRPKVAGIRGQNRLGRQDAPEGLHDATGMDAGPIPGLSVHDGRGLVGSAIRSVGRSSRIDTRRLQGGARQHAAGNSEEAGRVRRHHDLRPGSGSPETRLHINLRPTGMRLRNPVAERGRLTESTAKDQQRIRLLQPAQHARRRSCTGHSEVERVMVWKCIGPAPRRHDRDLHLFSETHERIGASGTEDPSSGEDQRTAGVRE